MKKNCRVGIGADTKTSLYLAVIRYSAPPFLYYVPDEYIYASYENNSWCTCGITGIMPIFSKPIKHESKDDEYIET